MNEIEKTQVIVAELNELICDFCKRHEAVFYKSPRTESGYLRYSLLSEAKNIVKQIRDSYQQDLDKLEQDKNDLSHPAR